MVQIIKNPNNELGAMLGKNLGTGLSALANQKLGELQQRQSAQGLQALIPNITQEQAQAFSRQSPELQKLYLKNKLEQPQNAAYAQAVRQLLSEGGSANPDLDKILAEGGGFNERQLTSLANIKSQQQSSQRAEQAQINNENKPYEDAVSNSAPKLKEIRDTAQAMKELDATGKVPSSFTGSLAGGLEELPGGKSWLSDEAQEYIALSKKLAGLKAQEFGVGTNTKIKFSEKQKANISHSQKARNYLLDKDIERADEGLTEVQTLLDLKRENQDRSPRNIKDKVYERLQSNFNKPKSDIADKKSNPTKYEIGNELSELPKKGTNEYDSFPEGGWIYDDNGVKYTKNAKSESGWLESKMES